MLSDARSSSIITSSKELSARTSTSPVKTRSRQPVLTTNGQKSTSTRRRSSTRYVEKEQLWTDYTPQHSPRTTSKQHTSKRRTNDLSIHEDATRDSMVENLLLSFNNIPHGQGPYPKQSPYPSHFEEVSFAPKLKHYRSSSPSSSISSSDDDKQNDIYKPRDTSYHTLSSTRSKKPVTRSTPTTPNRKTRGVHPNSDSIPPVWLPEDYQRHSQPPPPQELGYNQDMGFAERLKSRRSRSNSLTLSSYLNDGHRRKSSTATAATNVNATLAQLEGGVATNGTTRTGHTSMHPSTHSSAMTSRRPSIDSLPLQNFKQQVSSRDKVATITGSTNVLAENPYRRAHPPLVRNHSDMTGSESIATSASSNGRIYSPTDSTPTKERPSFFRRMFSSSRSSHSIERQPTIPLPAGPVVQPGTVRRGTSKQYSSQMIYSPSKPSTELPTFIGSETASTVSTTSAKPNVVLSPPTIPDDELQRPALKQKSSFFRRRRKPAPENEPMPVVVDSSPQLPTEKPDISAATSISSLRKAMDPLLAAAETSQTNQAKMFGDTDSVFSGLGISTGPTTPVKPRPITIDTSNTSSTPGFRSQNDPMNSSPRQQDLNQGVFASSLEVPSHNDHAPSIASSSSASVSEYATLRQPEYPPPLVGPRLSHPFASIDPATVLDQESPISPTSEDGIPPVPSFPEHLTHTSDLPLHDSSRPMLTTRIWLKPSQESVHMHSVPSLPSLETSEYNTPPIQHDSPALGGELASVIHTPVKRINSQQDTSALNSTLTSTTTTLARSVSESATSIAGRTDTLGHDISVAELGKEGPVGDQRRRLFMESFDFTGLNILQALRHLCGRLALKGETSQLDRIVTAFSRRWCDCNTNHGFKSEDIVHTIVYALLMLNTDLHSIDNSMKMTRQQFIRNALDSIKSYSDEDFDRDATIRAKRNSSRAGIPLFDDNTPSPSSDAYINRTALDQKEAEGQGSVRQRPVSAVPSMAPTTSPFMFELRSFENVALVNAPFEGSSKAWETQVEGVLKDFYGSVQQLRLPLFGGPDSFTTPASAVRPTLSTSASSSTMLRRSGSVMSKAVSERGSGRIPDFRTWQAKSRTKPKLPAIKHNSARSSIEDGGSVWSPSVSSTWSRGYGSASASSDTLATHVTSADRLAHHAPGFANAIQHAAAKDSMDGPNEDELNLEDVPMLEDESLALAGAPWAKEGIVHHKKHHTGNDKKSKNSKWEDCFAVVEKGNLSTFSFTSNASVRNQKNKALRAGPVGGGNWTESAQALCAFPLRQSLANVLPPPGFDKSRPYAFALSLPNGNVHFFQVGTPEIAKEFVSTANYWAARLSKEPLGGGISNIEYGWSDAIINASTTDDPANLRKASRSSASIPRSFDQQSRPTRSFPGDRASLDEWTVPAQSNSHSTLPEHEQLQALRRYINEVEHDLQVHNDLREPMLAAYSGRSANVARAMQNWEKRSSYLLSEIVRFRTYVEVLEMAGVRRREVDVEREKYEEEIRRLRERDNGDGALEKQSGSAEGIGLGVTTG